MAKTKSSGGIESGGVRVGKHCGWVCGQAIKPVHLLIHFQFGFCGNRNHSGLTLF